MYTHQNKSPENKSLSAANREAPKRNAGNALLSFVDNRSEILVQRKLQETVGNRHGASQRDPSLSKNENVVQLKWLDDGSDYYVWDAPVNQVRWFHHKSEDLMYYVVENPKGVGQEVLNYAGIQHAKPRQQWVALVGEDVMINEDPSVEAFDRPALASKEDHEALVAQFENMTASGGLMMHAVAGGEEVESLGYLIEQGKTLREIREGAFKTKLLSYIRTDLTMKTFAFRKMGLLVDWKRIWDVIGYDQGRATIFEEDQQSSREALNEKASFGEAGGTMEVMGEELHAMALRQNQLKKQKGGIGNWNEILSFNAVTAGVVGLLWVVDGSSQMEDGYDQFFTPAKKKALFQVWKAKTGMEVMPIYKYIHMGSPRGKAYGEAKEKLGSKGASRLVLMEKYRES